MENTGRASPKFVAETCNTMKRSCNTTWNTCLFCHKTFSTYYYLEMHLNTHTNERPYQCTECDANFAYYNVWHVHYNGIHLAKRYPCKFCQKPLATQSSLSIHEKLHCNKRKQSSGEIYVGKRNITMTSTSENEHNGNRSVTSKIVGTRLTGKFCMKICTFCNATFKTKSSLENHMNSHTKEQPYGCSECGSNFSCPSSLYVHRINVHSVGKLKVGRRVKNSCTFCDKGFSKKAHLEMHINTHTNERPYNCVQCKASFAASSNLTHHYKWCHRKSQLSKRTNSSNKIRQVNFKKNRKYGYNYPVIASKIPCKVRRKLPLETCIFCKKTFKTKNHLEMHVHPKKPPFRCCQCDAKFTFRSTLYVHRRSLHLGEKYRCKVCHKPFSAKSNLIAHNITHMKKVSPSQLSPISSCKTEVFNKENGMGQDIITEAPCKSVRFSDTVTIIKIAAISQQSVPNYPDDENRVIVKSSYNYKSPVSKEETHEQEMETMSPDSPSSLLSLSTENANCLSQLNQAMVDNQSSAENSEADFGKLHTDNSYTTSLGACRTSIYNHRWLTNIHKGSESNDRNVNRYSCPYCDASFARKRHWKNHLLSTHRMSIFLALTTGSIVERGNFTH